MHLAKGQEFRAFALIGCDEGVLPLTERVDDVADAFELDEVVATDRRLLYAAATRVRDRLFVSDVKPGSELLVELSASMPVWHYKLQESFFSGEGTRSDAPRHCACACI
ncbi:3'-5' exonuclease [Methylobacterium sp. WSM2598]|uniref:3'-5' exonuclease n=1 Tax=Methylobacterium sp. WSM2598 TaxID=398261 RepID=UPI00036EBAB6|nr:3'-5' exonuclease [Methylobacterium sp. WSM2598]